MSSINPEDRTDPEPELTPADIENLDRLEVQVADALDEIRERRLYRDRHRSFETYLRERWGVANRDEREPCEALARACEQTLSTLAGDEPVGIEIRLAVRKEGESSFDLSNAAEPTSDELVPTLRWLLSQAGGTIGEVAHHLESNAADVDDAARAQLRDDVLVVDGELAVVKALLVEFIDWDAELRRLLRDELPPLDADSDPDDDGWQW
jgi:hypothetical protein